MSPLSPRWMRLSAIGYGVLFSLALTGFVRLSFALVGLRLSESAAGNIFLCGSLVAGGVAAFMYGRILPVPPVNASRGETLRH